MLGKLLLPIITAIILSGCSLMPRKSGVEIISYPSAKVFIDGRELGSTPYKNSNLTPGEKTIKLVSEKGTWERKIRLQNNVSTVINWEWGETDEGGYVLTMEYTGDTEKAGLLVSANPDKCALAVGGEIKGFTPIKIDNISDGDRQVTISFPGHKSKNIIVRAMNSYQLVVDVRLIKEEVEKPVVETEPETEMEKNSAEKVMIKPTETGWLRVRKEAESNSIEVGRVLPGQTYTIVSEGKDWYQIDLGEGKKGWVSAKYVDKVSE